MYPPYHGLLSPNIIKYSGPTSIYTSWYLTSGQYSGTTSSVTQLFRNSFFEDTPGYLYYFIFHRDNILVVPEHFEILATVETPTYTPNPSIKQWTSLLRANNLDLGSSNTYDLEFESETFNSGIGKFIYGIGPFRETITSHSYLQTGAEPFPYTMYHDGPSVTVGGNGFVLFGGSCILGRSGSFQNNDYKAENMESALGSINPNRLTMGHVEIAKGASFTPNVGAFGREAGYFAEITIALTD